MPIIQISEIQNRRGLKQDLPEFEEGEIGLAVDTGEVFIGTPNLPTVERDVIAFSWEASRKYSIGDFVAETGSLYRCNTNHTSTSSFTGAYWDEVTIDNFANKNTQLMTEWSKNVENIIKYSYLNRADRINSSRDSNFGLHELANFYNDLQDDMPYQAIKRVGQTTYNELGVRRFLQERLDERVSVQSYGATGAGRDYILDSSLSPRTINDMDAEANAIRRATIDLANKLADDVSDGEIFDKNKALYFPGGTYVVNKSLFVTNRTKWIGDGKGKTRIVFNVENITVTEKTNALIQTIGTRTLAGNEVYISVDDVIDDTIVSNYTYENISTFVEDIHISGITFEIIGEPAGALKPIDLLRLIRVKNVVFENCEFIGNWDLTYTNDSFDYETNTQAFAIDSSGDSLISSSPLIPSNIVFNECTFSNFYFLSNATDHFDSLVLHSCKFENLYKGLIIGDSNSGISAWATLPPVDAEKNGPQNIKITTSRFENISSTALHVCRGYAGDGITRSSSYQAYLENERPIGDAAYFQVSGIMSVSNNYTNVGNYEAETLTNTNWVEQPKVPVIIFEDLTQYNMSFGDFFSRDIVDPSAPETVRVQFSKFDPNLVYNPQDAAVINEDIYTTTVINASNAFSNTFPAAIIADTSVDNYNLSYEVKYSIVYETIGTLARRRTGNFTITVDPLTETIAFSDDYTQLNMPDEIQLQAILDVDGVVLLQAKYESVFSGARPASISFHVDKRKSPNIVP